MKKDTVLPDISWKKDYREMIKKEMKKVGGKPMKIKTKQRVPAPYIQDLVDEFPKMLKDLGIMNCIIRILKNLYLMHPRPENPCGEIHELFEEAMGSSSYAKTELRILEREHHRQLLREFRFCQEIGKLKALCHFLLPEKYGPSGEILVPEEDDLIPLDRPDADYIVVELKEEAAKEPVGDITFADVELKKRDKERKSLTSVNKKKKKSQKKKKIK